MTRPRDRRKYEVLGRVCRECQIGDDEVGVWSGSEDLCGMCERRIHRHPCTKKKECRYLIPIPNINRAAGEPSVTHYCPGHSFDKPRQMGLVKVLLISPVDDRERVVWLNPKVLDQAVVVMATVDQWRSWR